MKRERGFRYFDLRSMQRGPTCSNTTTQRKKWAGAPFPLPCSKKTATCGCARHRGAKNRLAASSPPRLVPSRHSRLWSSRFERKFASWQSGQVRCPPAERMVTSFHVTSETKTGQCLEAFAKTDSTASWIPRGCAAGTLPSSPHFEVKTRSLVAYRCASPRGPSGWRCLLDLIRTSRILSVMSRA